MTQIISKGAANQAGARINKDAYAKAADFLPLKGIDHVEFWVGNARQASAYYRALWGFTPVAFSGLETKVRDRASYVMVQNDIRFVFTAPLTPDGEIAEHVRAHGDGVHDIAFAVDDVESAWRETTSRGAVSALEPTELDGGEDGVLRTVVDPHLRRGPPLVRRPARLPRRLRARLSQGQVAAAAAGGLSLLEVDHCVGNVGLGEMDEFVDFYRDVLGFAQLIHYDDKVIHTDYSRADVEGHDQRQRPDQVPDQRAGDRQEEEPDPGIPRLVPLARLPAHRAADRGHRRDRPAAARQRRRVPGPAARVLRVAGRPRRRRRRADGHARGAGHRGRPRRGGLPPPDLHAGPSRTARRSSSRSSSATARAASASATSRRSSRRSSASRRSAGTSRRGSRAGVALLRELDRVDDRLASAWTSAGVPA